VGKAQVDSAGIVSWELSLLVALCLFASITSWPWNIVAAIVSILIAISVFYDRYKRWKRSKLLKNPFETQFYIPKAIEHKVDYYPQDDDIHTPPELTLSANSEHDVMIRSRAKVPVTLIEVQYGCMDYLKGVDYLKAMPEPLYYINPWVKKGIKREIHPEANEDHYVDTANAYHIVYHGRDWPKGSDILNGLRIKTKEKGRYTFGVVYIMPEREAESSLIINVV
jgi:hypothetical protein